MAACTLYHTLWEREKFCFFFIFIFNFIKGLPSNALQFNTFRPFCRSRSSDSSDCFQTITAPIRKVLSVERINDCAHRSSLLVRNELPWCSYSKTASGSNVTLRLRLGEIPASRTSSLAVGGSKAEGASDAENCLVFPVWPCPPPSQCCRGTGKDLLPLPDCETLPESLIFNVCRLLVMMKCLAYSSQDQGKLTFLARTSLENAREGSYTLGWLLVCTLASCQNANAFKWSTILLWASLAPLHFGEDKVLLLFSGQVSAVHPCPGNSRHRGESLPGQ